MEPMSASSTAAMIRDPLPMPHTRGWRLLATSPSNRIKACVLSTKRSASVGSFLRYRTRRISSAIATPPSRRNATTTSDHAMLRAPGAFLAVLRPVSHGGEAPLGLDGRVAGIHASRASPAFTRETSDATRSREVTRPTGSRDGSLANPALGRYETDQVHKAWTCDRRRMWRSTSWQESGSRAGRTRTRTSSRPSWLRSERSKASNPGFAPRFRTSASSGRCARRSASAC
jgi:hypothetical protein